MKNFLTVCSGFLLLLIALPLVPSDFWLFRTFDYLLFQILLLLLTALAAWSILLKKRSGGWWIMTGLLVAAGMYGVYRIYHYLPGTGVEMEVAERRDQANDLTLLIANVYQHNNRTEDLIRLVQKHRPDLLLGLETDRKWCRALEPLHQDYPYRQEVPLENTYGMLLYSRLPLHNLQVHYLVQEDIPSIETEVALPSGRLVRFYGVHPRPPVPGESLWSTGKDKELILIGEQIRKLEPSYRPVVVAGDFNDVAWSFTTQLFRRVSGLLDARRGRGFFNTFPVNFPLLRFPLDQIFTSSHFELVEMQRLPSIGSDHFPLFIHLQSHQPFQQDQPAPKADSTDLEKAEEILDKEAPKQEEGR